MTEPTACGWESDLPRFRAATPGEVRERLARFVRDPSEEQVAAWDASIPMLQREAGELMTSDVGAREYGAILEYRLPLNHRRPDVVVLSRGAVVVLELKGTSRATRADLDQVAAYARDLRAYHASCADRPVHAVLVPTARTRPPQVVDGVHVVRPSDVADLLHDLGARDVGPVPSRAEFLSPAAYRPLPTLVQAARDLLEGRTVREVWKARATTDPAVDAIARIAHAAARDGTRHLVLVAGVPGSGKTLVGLRVVHARTLDDLAEPRAGRRPTAPAVFLSGNGPLVEVLQHALRGAGGGGRTFVRGVKAYLETHAPDPTRVPNEHVVVFDEAQRAFSAAMVAHKHPDWPTENARSEPEWFVTLADRVPRWSVLVGLIGTGQEIHTGEEGGLAPWRDAIAASPSRDAWRVHVPPALAGAFEGAGAPVATDAALDLDVEIRFHLTPRLHEFVGSLLGGRSAQECRARADDLRPKDGATAGGISLYVTRDLGLAKRYLHARYAENPDARYGLVASSRDRDLSAFGVENGFQATKNVRLGAWYADDADSARSCRRLASVVTEFGAQGLELDMALLAWGTDFRRDGDSWSNADAARYRGAVRVEDPLRLRENAYRVLLTRGRDGTVVFVPEHAPLDATYAHLLACGFRPLTEDADA